jgi:tight adherence protein B
MTGSRSIVAASFVIILVVLSACATTEAEEATPTPAPPVVQEPPNIPPSDASALGRRMAFVIGAGLWFIALAIAALVFLAPRRQRAQLAGVASGAHHGQGTISEFAQRATLLAERGLERRGYRGGLNAALERAGINLRPGEFVVLVGCAAITGGAVGRILHGWFVALVLTLVTVIASRLLVSFLAGRRQARFADQLGETLQLLSGSLRAGYSLMQAIDAVAREAPSPSAEEFSRLVVETRLGRETPEALGAMADRMQSDDFTWVIQAIEIHREVGGDLAEVLDRVGDTIRAREQIARQIKSLSAEGRLSAKILIGLPFVVMAGFSILNPGYLAELLGSGTGRFMLGVAAGFLAIGAVWINRLVKIEF